MLKFLLLMVSLLTSLAVIGWSGSFIHNAFGDYNCTNWKGLPDKDCDQLADTWETTGYDYNNDGTVDLKLSALGADPNVKDIFLEIDYMSHHKPRPGVIEAVTTAFQNSGVGNYPGNPTGIQLHILVDENMDPTGIDQCLSSPFPFTAWFGTSTDRLPQNAAILAAKKDTFHHALFIHSQCGGSSSGTSDTPGNQLIVSLGAPGWGTDPAGNVVGSVLQQEGTLMHELGHNLGLLHGGNDLINCKPNYISVMNWAFQFPTYIGLPFNAFPDYTWAFPDYSRWTSASLTESSLNENSGIGNPPPLPAGVKTAMGGGVSPAPLIKTLISVGTPVNYDDHSDTDTTEASVPRNLNNFGFGGTHSEETCNSDTTSTTPLTGYKDWGSAQWKFWGSDSGWYPGSPPTPSPGAPINATDIKSSQIYKVNAFQNIQSNQSPTDDLKLNHTDVTIEDVRTARHQLIQEINYTIQTLPDSAFVNSTSPKITRAYFEMQLLGQNNSIANLTQNDQLDKAISRLVSLREEMDSSFGGKQTDDKIVDANAQALVVPLIDNLKQVLVSQR